jgi:pyruvate,water dikinase
VLSGTLMGLPVSPGQVQGVIRILNEHDTLDQIPEGTILVTPSTDPAMLAFFPLAAGLIVEVGGMLSHGSIIAREYGLPAVSNITDARKRLKSGDRVLLDGTTGVVQILEPAEARQPAQEASLSKSIKR